MLDNLFLQILNMSITASFVILAVIAVRLLLKKVPRIISYLLWIVVLFRLVCPFSFESVVSLLPVKANPIPQEIVYQRTPQINTGNASLPAATPDASMNPLQGIVAVGLFLWLCGIAVLVIYSVVSLLLLKRKLRGAVSREGNVYLADGLISPFVIGLFHPRIYLPANLTEDEMRYILLHEQTHIKRLDHVVKIASFAVLCLHWFNPLVWAAFFLCGRDMEMSCDEAVLKRLGSEVKKDYSSSLLTLATGRRIVGGSPLAFSEGDTKSRIKNVLNYKKPAFWVVVAAAAAVIAVGIGLAVNPKMEDIGLTGVNAVILEIDADNRTMTVEGTDENSVIGDKCVVTWEKEPFITIATNSKPMSLSLDDFNIGDSVVLLIGEVQESYPTGAKAATIQLLSKEMHVYSADNLWSARTEYVGNNSAVSKLLDALPLPQGLQHDHFELLTSGKERGIRWFLDEVENAAYSADEFNQSALLLFALIDNLKDFYVTTDDPFGSGEDIHFDRAWADETVGCDIREYAVSPEKLQELINPDTLKAIVTMMTDEAAASDPLETAIHTAILTQNKSGRQSYSNSTYL